MKHTHKICTFFVLSITLFFSEAKSQSLLHWTPSNLLDVGIISKIAQTSEGSLFALADSGVIASTDRGANWKLTPSRPNLTGTEKYRDFAVSPEGLLLVGIGGNNTGAIAVSTDQGSHWTKMTVPGSYVGPMGILSAGGGKVLVSLGIQYGLYRTANFGATWDSVKSPGFTENSMGGFSMMRNGRIFNFGAYTVSMSDDTGKTWIAAQGDVKFGNPGGPIVNVVSNNGTDIFLADAGGVFFSSNSGTDWGTKNTGLNDLSSSGLIIDPKGYLFVSSYTGGVYVSTTKGDLWTESNAGLLNTHVQSLFMDKENNLYAGTVDKIYRTAATLAVNNNSFASGSTISQNPVTSNASIRYSTTNTGHVNLAIYDIMGKQIMNLVNKVEGAGSHEASFTASQLQTGTYYYLLQADGRSETKRIIVAH